MAIDPTSGASQSAGALGSPLTEATRSDLGPEAFMKLLIAQIKNQDPLAPTDTQAMMGQLTQLTEVERLVAIDSRLQSLQIINGAVANSHAAGLVGSTVEADTAHIDLDEIGSAQSSFNLSNRAETVDVDIRDGSGQIIRTISLGTLSMGQQSFTWDGLGENGQRLPPGRYSVGVRALTSDGTRVDVRTRITGQVRSVQYDGGYPLLSLDGANGSSSQVMMGDVRSISRTPSVNNP